MVSATKEQTAFRFEPELVSMMKTRAKSLGKTVTAYVTDLISEDIRASRALPKIKLPERLDEDTLKFAGKMRIPTRDELESDERLERIWNR